MNSRRSTALVIAFIGALAMVPLTNMPTHGKTPNRLATRTETAVAQSALRRSLKGPGSVRFEGYEYVYESGVVCGFFNAKNSYGGYVGTTPYAYDTKTREVVIFQRGVGEPVDRLIKLLTYCPN